MSTADLLERGREAYAFNLAVNGRRQRASSMNATACSLVVSSRSTIFFPRTRSSCRSSASTSRCSSGRRGIRFASARRSSASIRGSSCRASSACDSGT